MKTHFVAQNCTEIGPFTCTVDNTIYGYLPNLGLNAFFAATFALLVFPQLIIGTWKKSYFYSYFVGAGCIGEAIGYGGRVMMHSNPYGNTAFTIQIACLIFSPAWVAAGVYLVLKHVVRAFGEERSILPARSYTWIFITCDTISLVLQAIGGGMAGGAKGDQKKLDAGTNLMIVGIVWQVATLLVFASLVVHYTIRTRKAWGSVSPEARSLLEKRGFKGFLMAVTVAFFTIFLRCVYRIAEMVGGWANPIMRDEVGFVVMEGFMILIAASALTIFHPGFCFPQAQGKAISPMSGSDIDMPENQAEKGAPPQFAEVSR